MTPTELRDILSRLGLPQTGAAHLLGVDDRTMRRWVGGEVGIPEPVARVMRMAGAGKLRLERLATYASRKTDITPLGSDTVNTGATKRD